MRPIAPADLSQGVRALTDDMVAAVTRSAMRVLAPAIRRIATDIREGRFQAAQDGVRDLDFTEALSKSTARVRKFTRSAVILGSGAVDSPTTGIFANGAPYPWETDEGAVRLIQRMSAHILTRDTRRKLDQRVTDASRFQKHQHLRKGPPIDPDKLAKDINRQLRGEIVRVVDVSANVVGTRVAAYGMYYEARARGIATYRIDAILDDRTTDICRHMDGRTFRVEEAFTKTGTVLSISDPTDLKKVAPFPDLDEIASLSNEDLQARGFDTPPFHFLCRSVVTLESTRREYDPVDWSNFPERQDMGAHRRAMEVQYDREAESIWRAAAEDLFELALKSPEGTSKAIVYAAAYSGNMFNVLNQRLRKNAPLYEPPDALPDYSKAIDKPPDLMNSDAYLLEAVTTLDGLFERSTAPDVTYVYRGVRQAEADRMETGKVFQDDGFVSTTLDPDVALDFTSAGTKTVMQIQVGTGQRILPIYQSSLTPAEAEMLLPRGSQFRIVGKTTQVMDGEPVTVLRVVMQEAQGEVLDAEDVGYQVLPDPESVTKAEPGHEDKFVYGLEDLREARMT